MHWRTRQGRRYLYRNRRRDGKSVTDYLGSGPDAQSLFEEEQRRRAANQVRAVEQQAQSEQWQDALDKSDTFGDKVRQLAHGALRAGGYHQHARSSWRKRKMSDETESAATGLTDDEILYRASKGDETVRPLLADVLSRHPEFHQEAGDLGRIAERTWVALIARSNLVVEESVPARLAKMKADLAGPEPTPLERLLVDQVVLAWLQTHAASQLDAVNAGPENACKQRDELQRRHDRAQRYYLTALKTLATVRKLLRPVHSAVDLLMRNVPETTVPNSIKNRCAGVMRNAAETAVPNRIKNPNARVPVGAQ